MAKYKYIGNNRPNREHGKTYDGKSKANDWCYSVSELSLKHPNEWKLIQEKSPEELLLEEAKLRYPIGTKFYPAHISKNQTIFSLDKCISNGKFTFKYTNRSITVDDGINVDYGRSACPIVYNSELNKWAEIIEDKMEKLPEKWYIRITEGNRDQLKKWVKWHGDYSSEYDSFALGELVVSKNLFDNSYQIWSRTIPSEYSDYTEITFDDFKRLVLKENTMSEKKIIGYKIIKEFPTTDNRFVIGFVLNATKYGENGWGNVPEMAAKYPEFWEPVYGKSFPDITINGHKGVFYKDYVQFGCAEIGIDMFIGLYNNKSPQSNRRINSVTIGSGTFTKDQIKEIAEYYLNK